MYFIDILLDQVDGLKSGRCLDGLINARLDGPA